MFDNSKKFLKRNSFLQEKYKGYIQYHREKQNNDEKIFEINNSFVSDKQLEKIINNLPENSKFNYLIKFLNQKVNLHILDILYAIGVFILGPSIVSYWLIDLLSGKELINSVWDYISWGVGSFLLSGAALSYLFFGFYIKKLGGTDYKSVNTIRSKIKLYEGLRNNVNFNQAFQVILNNSKKMSDNYKRNTVGMESKEKNYDDVDYEDFNEIEKEFIKIFILDLEDAFFEEIGRGF